MPQHVRFVKRTTTELLRDPAFHPLVTAEPLMVAETVRLPPLLTGQHMFPHFQTSEEMPPDLHWHSPDYGSVQPWHRRFCELLVHGGAGIICIGDAVVSDTLQQTAPDLQDYHDSHDAIGLAVDRVAALPGRWLSLLGGNYGNYYHWTLEGLGRLAAVEIDGLAVDGILLPAHLTAVQRDGLTLTGITQGRPVRGVAPAEQVRPAQLLVPWSMTGFHRPHPMLRPIFARIRNAVAVGAQATPSLIYIACRPADRRAAAHRRFNGSRAIQRQVRPVRTACQQARPARPPARSSGRRGR